MKKAVIIIALIFLSFICAMGGGDHDPDNVAIPASPQSPGDAAKGYIYLTSGDYIKSGIPYNVFTLTNGKNTQNRLNRQGLNATVGHGYNVVKRNGVDLVVPTCLQCHSQVFDGKLVIGLGNTTLDFSSTKNVNFRFTNSMLRLMAANHYSGARDFVRSMRTSYPQLQTETPGVNIATKLAIVLAAHRDPQTLVWTDKPLAEIPTEVYPTDVPAWWLLKKKNAMFYAGFARGDMGKFMMIANLLTVKDSTEAREVSTHFGDVLAYIRSIEAPHYTQPVDTKLAAQGEQVFNANCSRCHGTYGAHASYPNLMVPLEVIGTDKTVCNGVEENKAFIDWFRKSWFVQGDNPPQIVPFNGYIAPPLDGVWITAPYLHNGSVPTIEALLNSSTRPTYWERDYSQQGYDYQALGYKYTSYPTPVKKKLYNTTLKGYSNAGHYFGDVLTETERKAVIEYLKTL